MNLRPALASRAALRRITRQSFDENYGRANIARAITSHIVSLPAGEEVVVVDLGAGAGDDLEIARKALGPRADLFGVEFDPTVCEKLELNGVRTTQIDIERDRLPFADGSVNIVIANQVIEHTKEIFWIFNEIQRVLRVGGIAIIGIPNIASFHNRIGMLFGLQPTQIEVLSAHVRGFTAGGFTRFVENGGCFRVTDLAGANFYPFPRIFARRLARLFPRSSWGLTITVQRTTCDSPFIRVLSDRNFETPFFQGYDESTSTCAGAEQTRI